MYEPFTGYTLIPIRFGTFRIYMEASGTIFNLAQNLESNSTVI